MNDKTCNNCKYLNTNRGFCWCSERGACWCCDEPVFSEVTQERENNGDESEMVCCFWEEL